MPIKQSLHNHYAAGAAISWLFSRVCGLRPLSAGFQTVQIAPSPITDLSWAETEYQCKYGMIRTRWEKNEKHFSLHVSLPEGVTGEVIMPDGKRKMITCDADITCRLK